MEHSGEMNFIENETRHTYCQPCRHHMTIPATILTKTTTPTTTTHLNPYYSKHKRRPPNFKMYTFLIALALITCTTLMFHIRIALAHNDPQCQPTQSFFCDIENYMTVHPFNNTLGHTTLEQAHASLNIFGFLTTIDYCKDKVPLFLCSLYFPVCVSSPDAPINLLLPCRDICEEARKCERFIQGMNMSWPEEWECDRFKSYKDFKMCVINNQKEGNNTQQTVTGKSSAQNYSLPPMAPNSPPPVPPPIPDSSNPLSVCDPGFWDCRFSDPKRPLCIDKKYVCDGKIDCYRNDTLGESGHGSDEMNCLERHCEEGQVHCDDKCISRFDICDGKPDCNSGIDELNCMDSTTDWIQYMIPITCLIVITSAVWCMLKRFLKRVDSDFTDDDKGQPCESIPSETHENISNHSPSLIDHMGTVIYQKPYQPVAPTVVTPPPPLPPQQIAPQQPLIQSPAHPDELLYNCREPMYQEPSILARSDAYERIIAGGYSGASSEYGYGTYNFYDHKDISSAASINYMVLPPAPPPTPAPPAPSSTSSGRSTNYQPNYYENIID